MNNKGFNFVCIKSNKRFVEFYYKICNDLSELEVSFSISKEDHVDLKVNKGSVINSLELSDEILNFKCDAIISGWIDPSLYNDISQCFLLNNNTGAYFNEIKFCKHSDIDENIHFSSEFWFNTVRNFVEQLLLFTKNVNSLFLK